MKYFSNNLVKKLAAIVAGMLIFLSAAIYVADSELLSSSRHMHLLSSFDIYSTVGTTVEDLLKNFLQSSGDLTGNDNTKTKSMTSLAENAVNPDMIKLNVDTIVNGLLLYFKGGSDFLPDVYLRPDSSEASSSISTNEENSEASALKPITDINIDKVNLSAILMYTNRQDISDTFSFIRLLHNTAQKVPEMLILITSACLLCIALMVKSRDELVSLSALVIRTAGFFSIVVSSVFYYLLKILLPSTVTSLTMSMPFSADTIMGYTSALCKPIFVFLAFTSLLFPISFFVPKLIKSFEYITKRKSFHLHLRLIKPLLSIFTVILIGTAIIKSSALLEDFSQNGLFSTYAKIMGINNQMKVIPAMNDTVYTLEIKLYDKKSGNPVPGALIEIEGNTADDGETISLNKSSDMEGSARFSIQAGTFSIGFLEEMFPEGFKLPAPYLVSINSAGTTTVTINLEEDVKVENSYDPLLLNQ